MRQIKFRAYHHQQGLLNSDQFRDLGMSMLLDGSVLFGDYVVEVNWTIMQFAGLKDKCGADIFEGDIVTSEEYPFQDEGKYNYHGVIEFIDGSFCRTLRCVNAERRGISDGIAETLDSERASELVVIGNIHQNPELLATGDAE